MRRRGGRKRPWASAGRWRHRTWPTSAGAWTSSPTRSPTGGASATWRWSTTAPAKSLALIPDTSISGRRVARELSAIIAGRGKPTTIVSDNRTEFTSNAILAWADERKVGLALHRAWQAAAERLHRELNGRLRDELLNETLFRSPPHARAVLEGLAARLQPRRPHSKLGWMTPHAYASALRGDIAWPAEQAEGSRAPGSCQEPPGRIRSTPDSRYDWMRNGGHVRGRRPAYTQEHRG